MPATPVSRTDVRIGARTGDAEDQARVRHEAVVDAEHRGAQVAAAAEAAVPVLDAGGRRRAARARVARRRRAVDRHAAHLHRREHAAQAPRPEPCGPCAATRRVRASGTIRPGGGRAARGELRAPDRRLRLGFAGEPAEELRARVRRLGLGADAVEERRALLLLPAVERIRTRAGSPCRRASAASIRAITSGVELRRRRRAPSCSRRPAPDGSRR